MLNLLKKKQTIYSTSKNIISKTNKSEEYNNQIIVSSPSWKEWSNSIYSYNKEYIKLLVHKDKLVNYLFKSYFNLTKKILQIKRKRFNSKRFSSDRLFLSEAEIKHTNTNVNITLFLFNKNKNYMKYKLNTLQARIYRLRRFEWNVIKNKLTKVFVFNIRLFKSSLYRQIRVFFYHIKSNVITRMNIFFNLSRYLNLDFNTKNNILSIVKENAIEEEKRDNNWRNIFISYIKKNKKLIKKNKKLARFLKRKIKFNNYLDDKLKKVIHNVYWTLFLKNTDIKLNKLATKKTYNIKKGKTIKPITVLNKKNFRTYEFLYYYQMLIFNKNKFTNWFLNYRSFGLINIISKIYNKRVEFNIVNLKSMHLNSNIYSEAIALKLRNRKNKLLTVLKKALLKIKLPRLFDLYNIDKRTYNLSLRKKDVLNSMLYKLISGVRFEASGRLTRRLIASRAIFKFRYVGSLKNIYSSYVGLPSVMLRGYLKSNVEYTMINSKTRNGAFGLKGWSSSY
jgi:hypothetical protein